MKETGERKQKIERKKLIRPATLLLAIVVFYFSRGLGMNLHPTVLKATLGD
jgi:hypothetical protein